MNQSMMAEFTINGKPLSSLRVVDLKEELEKRGLAKSGNKKELIEKLKAHMQLEEQLSVHDDTAGSFIHSTVQDTEIVKPDLESYKENVLEHIQPQIALETPPAAVIESSNFEHQQTPIDFSNSVNTTGNGLEKASIQGEEEEEEEEEEATKIEKMVENNFVEKETVDPSSLQQIVTASEEPVVVKENIQETPNVEEDSPIVETVEQRDEQKEEEDEPISEVDQAQESELSMTVEKAGETVAQLIQQESSVEQVISEESEKIVPILSEVTPETSENKTVQDESQDKINSSQNAMEVDSNHIEQIQVVIKPAGDNADFLHKEPDKLQDTKIESPIKTVSPEKRRLSIHKQPLNRATSAETLPKSEERKRRWGGSTGSNLNNSNAISSDALKELIKPSKVDNDNQIKTSFTIEQDKNVADERKRTESVSNDEPESNERKKTKLEPTTDSIESDEVAKVSEQETKEVRAQTPAKNPPSNVLLVSNLVRPFTLPKLKEILSKRGRILPEKFWIDGIKSKCYAVYESEQIAVESREYIHGLKWPMSNPNTLSADFVPMEELQQLLENEKEARDRAAAALVAPEPAVAVAITPVNKESVREKTETLTKQSDQRNRKEEQVSEETTVAVEPKITPAQNAISKIVFVRNLVRPFTLSQLKELLSKFGPIVEEKFWIDKIKSRCYAVYESEEIAEQSRNYFHGLKWPNGNPKTLISDFASESELDKCVSADRKVDDAKKRKDEEMKLRATLLEERKRKLQEEESAKVMTETSATTAVEHDDHQAVRQESKQVREWDREKLVKNDKQQRVEEETPSKRQRKSSVSPVRQAHREDRSSRKESPRSKRREKGAFVMEDLFRKTQTRPYLYWLPVPEEEVARRLKSKRIDEERNRHDTSGRSAGNSGGRPSANGGGGGRRSSPPPARRALSPKRGRSRSPPPYRASGGGGGVGGNRGGYRNRSPRSPVARRLPSPPRSRRPRSFSPPHPAASATAAAKRSSRSRSRSSSASSYSRSRSFSKSRSPSRSRSRSPAARPPPPKRRVSPR